MVGCVLKPVFAQQEPAVIEVPTKVAAPGGSGVPPPCPAQVARTGPAILIKAAYNIKGLAVPKGGRTPEPQKSGIMITHTIPAQCQARCVIIHTPVQPALCRPPVPWHGLGRVECYPPTQFAAAPDHVAAHGLPLKSTGQKPPESRFLVPAGANPVKQQLAQSQLRLCIPSPCLLRDKDQKGRVLLRSGHSC